MNERWRVTSIGDVASINPEKTPSWADDESIRYVDIASVSAEQGINVLSIETIRWDAAPGRARRRIREGDVLVSTVRPNLRAFAIVPAELDGEVASTGFAVLRASDEVLPGFLWALVRGQPFVEAMVARCTGSNYPAIRASDVGEYEFALPPLPVQRRIVDLMEHLDNQVNTLRTEETAAEHLASRLRQAVFAPLARSHPLVRADTMFEMCLGRQKSARQSIGDHVYPYVRAANIGLEGWRLDDVQTMNFEPREQEKYALYVDDIALVEGGSIGLAQRWTGEMGGFVGFDKHIIRIRAVPDKSSSEYALQWCKWSRESGAFAEQATGITIKALGFGRASAMQIPDLPLAAQVRRMAPLASADAVGKSLREEIAALSAARDSLLTGIVSGSRSILESYDELLGVAS